MSFANPAFLAALAVLPIGALLYAQARRRRRRFAVRFPAAATVAAVSVAVPAWRRRIPLALVALAAAALAVALARPQKTIAVPIERASVVLITDSSRSMLADDVSPTRLEAARDAADNFVDRAPDKLQIGFVAFSTAPHTVIDPTLEHDTIREAIEGLQADGGTATGDALIAALERLKVRRGKDGRRAPAAIILLSDGKTTVGSDPLAAARQAGRLRIPIFTVALGTDQGILPGNGFQPPVSVPPDPETLRRIAKASGGRAYEVADAKELDRIYQTLGSKVGTKREKREVTSAFAGAGLLLLLAGLGTGLRWRGRLP